MGKPLRYLLACSLSLFLVSKIPQESNQTPETVRAVCFQEPQTKAEPYQDEYCLNAYLSRWDRKFHRFGKTDETENSYERTLFYLSTHPNYFREMRFSKSALMLYVSTILDTLQSEISVDDIASAYELDRKTAKSIWTNLQSITPDFIIALFSTELYGGGKKGLKRFFFAASRCGLNYLSFIPSEWDGLLSFGPSQATPSFLSPTSPFRRIASKLGFVVPENPEKLSFYHHVVATVISYVGNLAVYPKFSLHLDPETSFPISHHRPASLGSLNRGRIPPSLKKYVNRFKRTLSVARNLGKSTRFQ